MKKLYFLGPSGTYSEQCAKKIANMVGKEYILEPVSTITKIIDLLDKDIYSLGVLPIENSIEGIVRPTIDGLYSTNVKICAQIDIKIEHCLFSKGKKENIRHIVSHPQAIAQCCDYILNNFDKNIDIIETKSTAAAVDELINKNISYAAISSFEAGNKYNLNLLDVNIGNIKDNKTRFVLVSKSYINFGRKIRTSIVFNTKNEPGALLKILQIFKKYNLNLVYLESRPSKKYFGEYNFFADIDKGLDEIKVALDEVEKECNFYKFLGSYPSV